MKVLLVIILNLILFSESNVLAQKLPHAEKTLEVMRLANQYFMATYPDPGKDIVVDETWPKTEKNFPIGKTWKGTLWTRGVYFQGLMSLYSVDPRIEYYNYAVNWGEVSKWNLSNNFSRNADVHCAGQTYIDLYEIDRKEERMLAIKAAMDSMLRTSKTDDWTWIDAIHMGMPIFARLGRIYNDKAYFERMYRMYHYVKFVEGGKGMFNPKDGLWWRDKNFIPPYTEPNGEDCYWSRGNGWVFAALCRVLDNIPEDEPNRNEYLNDLKTMANVLLKVQRQDGFWNVSLHDSDNYGGKETTGTSLFVYGMAWGINNGVLNKEKYLPVVAKAWNALITESVHSNGFLGFVQGTGKEPASSQPVSYNQRPDFEDFGLGCFLMAGSEMYKLSQKN